jgi:hypothetical protein
MRVLYNGWERWITTMGSDIKIGDGSKKTFQTVMGTWREDSSQTLKMEEKQDDEETWVLEGGYSSDRGHSRHSLDYHSGKLGENLSAESEGEQEEEGEDSDGENERSPPLFGGAKEGSSKTNSDDVLASLTKIQGKGRVPSLQCIVLQWQQGAKEGTSRHWHVGSSGFIGF